MVRTRSQTAPPAATAPSCSCPPSIDLSLMQCSVCLDFPRLTNNTDEIPCCSNGHMTCTSCSSFLVSPTCPFCRSNLDSTSSGTLISRLLVSGGHLVICKHGCGEQGSLVEVSRHEEHCLSGVVMCSFDGCEKMILSDQMIQHQATCIYRPVECPKCQFSFSPQTWSTGHPGCFTTLDDLSPTNNNNNLCNMVLLGDGRNTLFIRLDHAHDNVMVGVAGPEDGEVRVTLFGGKVVALLQIGKWPDGHLVGLRWYISSNPTPRGQNWSMAADVL